jgi:hypothetical protein
MAAAPSVVSAAPHHSLTINAAPNPIITGDSVVIYGQLNRSHHKHQTIVLYHAINPFPFFTVIGTTKTDSHGFYKFTREEGIVDTNRSWFVRAPLLPGNIHSRTIHERVAAALSLAASSPTGDTGHPITFTGQINPLLVHVGERVWLQAQEGVAGDEWHTIKSGRIDSSSDYSIAYRFAVPGVRDLRVAFRGDVRNIPAVSDAVTVAIQQLQNPTFTINTLAPIIDDMSSATISGVLYKLPAATPLVPDPGVMVTLCGREDGQKLMPLGSTMTGPDGSYSFTQMPAHNTQYVARTTSAPFRHSAFLFEGVRDLVTITPSATTAEVGQTITFTGSVSPDKRGHVIELQRRGKDGDFHTVEIGLVNASSAYMLPWTFGSPGAHVFRTLVPGGPENVSGHSPAVTITVTLPDVALLPPTP